MGRNGIVGLVVALALAAGGYIYLSERPVAVTTVAVTTGTAAEVVYASGVVEPKTWAKVTSLVRERIVEVCGCEGQPVAAGALLVRLDDSEVRANMRELDARRTLLLKELDRAAALFERNVGSRQMWERASAALSENEASLAALQEKSNEHRITAPIAGDVLRLDASVGEIVEPGEEIAWVGQPRPLEVVAEVNEEDIPRVKTGQKVLLRSDAYVGQALAGTVGTITPKGDPVAKTYRVRIALPNDTPLFIGMTVDANVVIREVPDRVIVPVAALTASKVAVVENGRMVERSVKLGIRGLETAEVTEGLASGDQVVMPIPEGLTPGDRVVVREAGS